jgi:hypothetical protein
MSESRHKSIGALLALAVAVIAGCSGGDLVSTSSISVTSSIPVPSSIPGTSSTSEWSTVRTLGENDGRTEASAYWSPAETLPTADAKTISDALGAYDLHMLFPSQIPLAGLGPSSAQFQLVRTPSSGITELILLFETENSGVDLTLISSASPTPNVMWGTENIAGSEEVVVRGQPGRSFPRSDVSRARISWQEEGQYFVADYRGLSVELTAEQMIAWLDSWYMLPVE